MASSAPAAAALAILLAAAPTLSAPGHHQGIAALPPDVPLGPWVHVSAAPDGKVTHEVVDDLPDHFFMCEGVAPANTGCSVRHGPWRWSPPTLHAGFRACFLVVACDQLSLTEPYSGSFYVAVQGDYGATDVLWCVRAFSKGSCSLLRDDYLQCCSEPFEQRCGAVLVENVPASVAGAGRWRCWVTYG